MRHDSLFFWYLDNYTEEEKNNIELNKNDTFDSFDLRVKICDMKGENVHFLQVANFNRTLIIGSAGSGKTYLLKKILNSNFCKSANYYMYFDLRDYKGEEIIDLICKRIGCRNSTRGIIKKLLNEGEISLIFDNYNDISKRYSYIFKEKVLNNFELRNVRFLISSEEYIRDINFTEVYHIKSFSTREVYKKVIRKYFNDYYDFKQFKDYLSKNKMEFFLYKPLNLNYIIKIIELTNDISFVYKLKNESNLYAKFIRETIKSKKNVRVLSYISYYLVSKGLYEIEEKDIRILVAEALREYDKDADIEKTVLKIKRHVLLRSKIDKDIYRFKDKNLMMSLNLKYLKDNKIKTKNIIHNENFNKYFVWICNISEKFIYDSIFEFENEVLINILNQVEDKKAERFYKYINLFLSGSVYIELLSKLNIIYQRFRFDDYVQEKTLEFLKNLDKFNSDMEKITARRIVAYIYENENVRKVYMINEKMWLKASKESELIRRIYVNIIKADYIEQFKIYRKLRKTADSLPK